MAAFGNSDTYSGIHGSKNTNIVIDTYIPDPVRVKKNSWIKLEEVATQFRNRIVIDPEQTNIAHLVHWCFENNISQNHYDIANFYCEPDGQYMRVFSFAKKEDAMAFKLTFL